jgi:CRISPR/Cas system-associated exonuclease Cas4 (RecB family)
MGSRVEEDVIVPYLQQTVATDETYVQNSMWIDYTIETDVGDIQIKGVTDPVIVDKQSTPLLPTEVKTTASIEHLDSPNDHHRAQLHAYLVGLSREYDKDLTDGILIYVSRETFDLKPFHVTFDMEFWNGVVLHWASNHTEFRLNEELPPAQPEESWECKFCSYRERCGKGKTPRADLAPVGFVPGYTDYPRVKVIEHLEAHENAKLTPALAEQYPDIANQYSVQSWECSACSAEFDSQKITSEYEPNQNPLCPECAESGTLAELRISGSQSGGE